MDISEKENTEPKRSNAQLEMNLDIAGKLLTLRWQKGFSQTKLAAKSGVSFDEIASIENAAGTVNLNTLVRLAETMGSSIRLDFKNE